MGQPKDNANESKLHSKEQPLNQFLHEADKVGQSMLHEVQQDWQKASTWVKTHPHEDGMIAGGALILTGVALYAKDRRDGAAAILEGQKIMKGEQVVSEATVFAKTGSEGSLTTAIKFGNNAKDNLWIDPNSGVGRRLMEQGDGLGSILKK